MATTTSATKRCVNCHKDVSSGKRMKDSSGRYWCVDCGAADQKKKLGGETCGGCGESFPAAKLSRYGASKLCSGCIKRRTSGPGLMDSIRNAGGGGGDKKRMAMMLLVVVVLGLVAAARFMKWF